MSDRGARADRAAELDQLANDLDAMYWHGMGTGPNPFPDDRPGPSLEDDDRHAPGYQAVAEYVRQRADWLREG
ncbi:hypothetical protein [Embleya sp. NPDC005971]|uniref:hypothetical protein n=1 Tax=Embleya sp. NPDC005971 TaxID=3156724 RepID=UPI0033FF42D4